MRLTELTPQSGTITASLINLGCQDYAIGRAITFNEPNTINIVPGLYEVTIAGDFAAANATDTIIIQPLIDGDPIIGSLMTVTFDQAYVKTSDSAQFYVSTDCMAALTFQMTATDINDTVVTFSVTVIRV